MITSLENYYQTKTSSSLQKLKLEEIINKISKQFPTLNLEIKWNQPMFILNKTFIISFSCAKNHISVAIEDIFLKKYTSEFKKNNYQMSLKLFKILNSSDVNFELLFKIIKDIIDYKKNYDKFWL